MSLLDEYTDIISEKDKILAEIATDLFSELQTHSIALGRESGTPVDTGALRLAWELTKTKDGYTLSNNMKYASIIFAGFHIGTDGKLKGSKQLPNGIAPVLARYNKILQNKLKAL